METYDQWSFVRQQQIYQRPCITDQEMNAGLDNTLKLNDNKYLLAFRAYSWSFVYNVHFYIFQNNGSTQGYDKKQADSFGGIDFTLTDANEEFAYILSYYDLGYLDFGYYDFYLNESPKGSRQIQISDPTNLIYNPQIKQGGNLLYITFSLYDTILDLYTIELKIIDSQQDALNFILENTLQLNSNNFILKASQLYTLQAYNDKTALILALDIETQTYYKYQTSSEGIIQPPVLENYNQFTITPYDYDQSRNHRIKSVKLLNSQISTSIFIKNYKTITIMTYNQQGEFICIKDYQFANNQYNFFNSNYGLINNDYIWVQVGKFSSANEEAVILLYNPKSCQFYNSEWSGSLSNGYQLQFFSQTYAQFGDSNAIYLNTLFENLSNGNCNIEIIQTKITPNSQTLELCGPFEIENFNCDCIGDIQESYSRLKNMDCQCPTNYYSIYPTDDNCQSINDDSDEEEEEDVDIDSDGEQVSPQCFNIDYQIQQIDIELVKLSLDGLVVLPDYTQSLQKFNPELCQFIFEQQQLIKFGNSPSCYFQQKSALQKTYIFIQFNDYTVTYDATEIVTLKSNIFAYNNCGITNYIKDYINVDVITTQEEQFKSTQILMNYSYVFKQQDNIDIQIFKIINDGYKDLNYISWQIINVNPSISQQNLDDLNTELLDNYQNKKYINLDQGSLQQDKIYTFNISYTNYLNQQFTQQFTVQISSHQPQIQLQSTEFFIKPNLYYDLEIILFNKQYSSSNNYQLQYPKFSYIISYINQKNDNNNIDNSSLYLVQTGELVENNEGLVYFNIQPYQYEVNKDHYFQIQAQFFVNEKIFTSYAFFKVVVDSLKYIVYILGGSQMRSFKQDLKIHGYYKDPNIQDKNLQQEDFTLSWKCIDTSTQKSCKDKNQNDVIGSQKNNGSLFYSANDFEPFSIFQFFFTAEKYGVTKTHNVVYTFIQDELPELNVTVPDEHLCNSINKNDFLYLQTNYESNNSNDVIYQLLLVYNDEKVAIKNFDYKNFKFRIWDLFNNFENQNYEILAKVIVYDTQYSFYQSFSYIIDINQPPVNGTISIYPSSGISIETEFTISALNFVDENTDDLNLMYQFSYFLSYEDYHLDCQIGSKQTNSTQQIIQGFSKKNQISTILPRFNSTNNQNQTLVIFVEIRDFNYAISNITQEIQISYNEDETEQFEKIYNKYDILVQNGPDIQILTQWQQTSILCVLVEELSQAYIYIKNNEQLCNLVPKMYQKLLQQRQKLQYELHIQQVDRSITKLIQIMNKQQKCQQNTLINQIINQNQQKNQKQLQILKELSANNLLNQYDPLLSFNKTQQLKSTSLGLFQMDNLINTLFQQQDYTSYNEIIQIINDISEIYNYFMLPNQDQTDFQGQFIRLNQKQQTVSKLKLDNNLIDYRNNNLDQNSQQIYNIQETKYQQNYIISENYPYPQQQNEVQNYRIHIQQDPDQILNLNNQTTYNFNNHESTDITVCASSDDGNFWSTDKCQTVNNSDGTTKCLCDSKGFITVFEDFEKIFSDSVENIGNTFTKDSINNFEDFAFYKCIFVYLITFIGILQFFDQRQGYKRDKIDKNNLQIKNSFHQQNLIDQGDKANITSVQNQHSKEKKCEKAKVSHQIFQENKWETQDFESTNSNINVQQNEKFFSVQKIRQKQTKSIGNCHYRKNVQKKQSKILAVKKTKFNLSNDYKQNKENDKCNFSFTISTQENPKINNFLNEPQNRFPNMLNYSKASSKNTVDDLALEISSVKDNFNNRDNSQLNFKQSYQNIDTSSTQNQENDKFNFKKQQNKNNSSDNSSEQDEPVSYQKDKQNVSSISDINSRQNDQENQNNQEQYSIIDLQSDTLREKQKSQEHTQSEIKPLNQFNKLDYYYIFLIFHQYLSIQLIYMKKSTRTIRYIIYFLKQYQSLSMILFFTDNNYNLLQTVAFSIIILLFTSFPKFILRKIIKCRYKILNIIGIFLTIILFLFSFWLMFSGASKNGIANTNQQTLSYVTAFLFDFMVTQAIFGFFKYRLIKRFGIKNKFIRFLIPKQVRQFYSDLDIQQK